MFQAKQDYGIDFEATINKQAQAELQYQIDGEAVYMISDAWADAQAKEKAETGDNVIYKDIEWTDANPDTVSYSMKAEGFSRALEQAKVAVYKRTQKLQPTWMLCSPDVLPILTFVPGFKASGSIQANGPFVAGTVNGLKVIVSPALVEKEAYLGVLGSDGVTATGVFAPYMPLVPTQLLGFADGTMSQGLTQHQYSVLRPAV